MEKITYIDALNYALLALSSDEVRSKGAENHDEFVNKLIALRDKTMLRNIRKSGKPTKKQEENTAVKAQIIEFLRGVERAKCGEAATAIGISGQKCSSLLSQMVKAGEVVKTEEKRVSYFSLADEDDSVQALPSEISM